VDAGLRRGEWQDRGATLLPGSDPDREGVEATGVPGGPGLWPQGQSRVAHRRADRGRAAKGARIFSRCGENLPAAVPNLPAARLYRRAAGRGRSQAGPTEIPEWHHHGLCAGRASCARAGRACRSCRRARGAG
jgi:hypothetical protein